MISKRLGTYGALCKILYGVLDSWNNVDQNMMDPTPR